MVPERIKPVLLEVEPLANRFVDAGHDIYLVGGVVRDLFSDADLGAVDIDLTTDATPDRIKELARPVVDSMWTQGERFGTIGVGLGDRTYEITTHRSEAYTDDSRKPVVRYSSDIEEDLSRRDFTVNAMALALPEPLLVDPFDGLGDLAAKRLRTPLQPDVSFSDDPLRMMRAARFIAGYGLEPTPELLTAVTALRSRMEIVSAERIRDELDKLLVVDDPSAGLWFLVDTGVAEEFFPELRAMRVEQDPIHRHKDVLTHTIAVVAKTRPERIVRLSALFHDIGKPKTRSFGAKGVSFHHHEVVGARMTRERMRSLRYSSDDVDAVTQLVYLHLRFHTYRMGWSDSAVRRFVRDAGPLLEQLIELTRCDCTTRNKRKAATLSARMDELVDRIAELGEAEELAKIRPDLDGGQIMAHLGIEPGRAVGEALGYLLELRLDDGPLSEDDAFARLDEWWAQRTSDD